MERLQVAEERGGGGHAAATLPAPPARTRPPLPAADPMELGVPHYLPQALVLLEDAQVVDRLPAREVEEQEGDRELALAPALRPAGAELALQR